MVSLLVFIGQFHWLSNLLKFFSLNLIPSRVPQLLVDSICQYHQSCLNANIVCREQRTHVMDTVVLSTGQWIMNY